MNDDELRDILGRVAAGELDADEAARLLDPDAGDGSDDELEDELDDEPDEYEPEPAAAEGQIARELRVTASARKVRIVGDPSVREILVRGASIRRRGGLLVVDAEPDWDSDDREAMFVFAGAGPWWWGSDRDRDRDAGPWGPRGPGRGGHHGPGGHRGPGPRGPRGRRGPAERRGFDFRPVDVRANPDLALSLEVEAGSARVSGMRGRIKGSVSAGSAAFSDVRGPFDLSASAGSLTVQGPIARGDSRINCELGSVKLRLEPGSDVRISVDATMSKPDVRLARWTGPGDRGEWIVGDGTASLAIVSSMASVKIREIEGA
jgi:hypothetical protein